MKHLLAAASLALLMGTTVGCSEDSPDQPSQAAPPDDASTEEFCQNYQDFSAALMKLGQDAEDADFVKALKAAGEDFEATGTPEDVSEDERAGYEVFIQLIEDVEDDATQEDLQKMEQDLSEEEQKQLEGFTAYVSQTCES